VPATGAWKNWHGDDNTYGNQEHNKRCLLIEINRQRARRSNLPKCPGTIQVSRAIPSHAMKVRTHAMEKAGGAGIWQIQKGTHPTVDMQKASHTARGTQSVSKTAFLAVSEGVKGILVPIQGKTGLPNVTIHNAAKAPAMLTPPTCQIGPLSAEQFSRHVVRSGTACVTHSLQSLRSTHSHMHTTSQLSAATVVHHPNLIPHNLL
jgi:hypothetical protein